MKGRQREGERDRSAETRRDRGREKETKGDREREKETGKRERKRG